MGVGGNPAVDATTQATSALAPVVLMAAVTMGPLFVDCAATWLTRKIWENSWLPDKKMVTKKSSWDLVIESLSLSDHSTEFLLS
jgi:hypothetical protein